MSDAPIIIIGSGLAAYTVAKEFRQYDTNTKLILITSEQGDFYSKPLLSTALTYKRTPEALVTTAVDRMREKLNASIITQAYVQSIDKVAHQIVFIDEKGTNHSLNYSKLILACGAKVRQLSLSGDGAADLLSVNDIADYARFRECLVGKQKIAVIGAGLVGCEFTNDLLNNDYEVDIITLEQQPLTRLVPPKIGQVLAQAFMKLGCRWHLQTSVVAAQRDGGGLCLQLSNGKQVCADLVLSAVGLIPNDQLAAQAGLVVDQGIVVNEFLQSSDQAIYALGDCARIFDEVKMYVSPLLQCARALAKTLAGESQAVIYPAMPVIIKTPACPLISLLPAKDAQGEWQFEGEDNNWRALYYNKDQQLLGFVLSGSCVRERMGLIKSLA